MFGGLPFREAPSDRRCSLGGYLWKMKKSNKQKMYVPKWTKRWFSIEGPSLKWYSSQNAAEAAGQIDIKIIKRVSKVSAENGIYSFTVESNGQRTLLLRAESKKILDMWCRAIQMHTDLTKGGDGTSVVTESPVSLNVRVQKKETLEDQLQMTERKLFEIERDLNPCSSISSKDNSDGSDECAAPKHGPTRGRTSSRSSDQGSKCQWAQQTQDRARPRTDSRDSQLDDWAQSKNGHAESKSSGGDSKQEKERRGSGTEHAGTGKRKSKKMKFLPQKNSKIHF